MKLPLALACALLAAPLAAQSSIENQLYKQEKAKLPGDLSASLDRFADVAGTMPGVRRGCQLDTGFGAGWTETDCDAQARTNAQTAADCRGYYGEATQLASDVRRAWNCDQKDANAAAGAQIAARFNRPGPGNYGGNPGPISPSSFPTTISTYDPLCSAMSSLKSRADAFRGSPVAQLNAVGTQYKACLDALKAAAGDKSKQLRCTGLRKVYDEAKKDLDSCAAGVVISVVSGGVSCATYGKMMSDTKTAMSQAACPNTP